MTVCHSIHALLHRLYHRKPIVNFTYRSAAIFVTLHYMLSAQLFLQSQLTPRAEHSLNNKKTSHGLSAYLTENTIPLKFYRNRGNRCVTQSLTDLHQVDS